MPNNQWTMHISDEHLKDLFNGRPVRWPDCIPGTDVILVPLDASGNRVPARVVPSSSPDLNAAEEARQSLGPTAH